jgi:hypothetical protein
MDGFEVKRPVREKGRGAMAGDGLDILADVSQGGRGFRIAFGPVVDRRHIMNGRRARHGTSEPGPRAPVLVLGLVRMPGHDRLQT